MVVGCIILAILLNIIVYYNCEAVSCFDLQLNGTGYLQRKTSCEGDFCIYYQPGAESKFFEEKSCVTGFQLPLGCFNSSADSSVMCVCDSDYCNHGRIDAIVDNIPQYACHVNDQLERDTMNGTFCMMSIGIERDTFTSQGFVGALRGSDALPLSPGYMDLAEIHLYSGMVYTINQNNGRYRSHRYKCAKDFCNNITITALPVLQNVTCFDGEIRIPESPKCSGEFCVYAEDSFRNLRNRFCLSTFNLHSDHSYKAGVYKYKTTSYFLCKEDGCNFNETTANNSIPEPAAPSEGIIVVDGSFLSLENLKPEYLFAALSALSCTVFLTLTALVVSNVMIDPRYIS